MKITLNVQDVIKARIQEHKYLIVAIDDLEQAIADYIPVATIASHVTYANLAILLASYKKAAEVLECILENVGVIIDEDGYYREAVDRIVLPTNDNEPQDQPQSEQENEH